MAQSGDTLKAMVRSGSTRIEIRNQVHDKVDLAAATLARCAGPAVFPALHEALFARQAEWMARAIDWDQTNGQRMSLYPQLAQLRAAVDGAGLDAIARGAGMSAAAVDACFADDKALDATMAVTRAAAGVPGTPAFAINGRMVDAPGWTQLQPLLRAAGAR
jgi:protein-disulfide isomerase